MRRAYIVYCIEEGLLFTSPCAWSVIIPFILISKTNRIKPLICYPDWLYVEYVNVYLYIQHL